MQFLQYWENLQSKLPAGQVLPSKQSLGRVNKLRVDLKHHGNIPSSHAIAQSKADVTTFFTDAARMIFNIDFETVDMADLVAHPEVARLLHEARTHFEADRVVSPPVTPSGKPIGPGPATARRSSTGPLLVQAPP